MMHALVYREGGRPHGYISHNVPRIKLKLAIAICLLSCLLCIVGCGSSSQSLPEPLPELQEGWTRVEIDGVGSIDIPPSMEVQSADFDELKENITGTHSDSFVIQPAGTNELSEEALDSDSYMRIMISTQKGAEGEFLALTEDIPGRYLDELNDPEQYKAAFSSAGLTLTSWDPPEQLTINGMKCVHMRYTRTLGSNSPVVVDLYGFQNVDRLHTLLISRRVSNRAIQDDLDKILDSFRITNIRG